MLAPFARLLSANRIVLASGSPRRKQILENAGLKIDVVVSDFEENLDKSLFASPAEYATETAFLKTVAVAEKLKDSEVQPLLIVGADTVVTMNGKIYEKPNDEDDAFHMLSQFSGKCHTVVTGVVILMKKPDAAEEMSKIEDRYQIQKFTAATEVEFETVTPEIISSYIATGEPMDKAGGYGIQAIGGTLVKAIHGDYFNVMGFPLNQFAKRFAESLRLLSHQQ